MPFRPVDIAGNRFTRLTAIKPIGRRYGGVLWSCQCACGQTTAVTTGELRAGYVKSCGCLLREHATRLGRSARTHGHASTNKSRSPEYHSYYAARRRCLKPNHRDWHSYGGRGIEFRFASFEQFLAHIGTRPRGTTVDRIDNDGHYEPGNVQWATPSQQQYNQRRRK